VETGNDFRFTFGHVKRRAVSFCHTRNQIDHEHREQGNDVPVEHTVIAVLTFHDVAQIQTLCRHQHGDQRKPHRDFVRHDLCR
jgi:hypothetical protein